MSTKKSEHHQSTSVRDLLRHAVRRFTAAKLAFGHGTDNARDEAAFLILEGLHLPIDGLDRVLKRQAEPVSAKCGELRRPAKIDSEIAVVKHAAIGVDPHMAHQLSSEGDAAAPIVRGRLEHGDRDRFDLLGHIGRLSR